MILRTCVPLTAGLLTLATAAVTACGPPAPKSPAATSKTTTSKTTTSNTTITEAATFKAASAGITFKGDAAGPARVAWAACPSYTDEVLRARGVPAERLADFRAQLERLECGTVTAPRDYTRPEGGQITVAVTRLRATDRARRLGAVAVNPGGPGGSGYLMPVELVMGGTRLNDRYDLIGFDPRGVGYSTRANCPGGQDPRPPSGTLSEEQARRIGDAVAERNRACSASDPAFLGQLTTANVARDLDRVREALGERRIGFFGVSWGTWLGTVYRSLFPGSVHRMWLDSVALPAPRMDVFEEVRARATARDFDRMAAWIARRNATYGFGGTKEQVKAALAALRRSYDEHPVTFTDLPMPVDGAFVAQGAAQASPAWPDAAQVFKELRDASGGGAAPPTVKKVAGGEPRQEPPGTPERSNPVAQRALFCNEDAGDRSFASAWDAYRRRLARWPVTGRSSLFFPPCAGWTLPVRTTELRRGGGSLMLSGHLHEGPSPYEWTLDTQAAVGGTVVTVDDDVHGSALHVPGCAEKMAAYFETGRRTRACPGVPLPE